MNTVDLVILAIIGLSVLVGLYRGFVSSVASLGSCILSLLLSYWLNPHLVSMIQSNPNLIKNLMSYTDAATRIGDQTLAQTNVATLTSNGIADILARVNLPAPLNTLLQSNLEKQVFQPSNLTQVGDYVSQTIVGAVLNVICFILCFIVCTFLLHILLGFLKVVFRFPILKQLNALTGGIFGLLRGGLFCIVAFAMLPLLETVLPLKGIQEMVAESTLAPLFNSGELILSIMRGRLF